MTDSSRPPLDERGDPDGPRDAAPSDDLYVVPPTAGGSAPASASVGHFPSPVFLALVAAASLSGWLLWTGSGPSGFVTFVFVASAWVISLCFHEFAHALVAYVGGDRSVAGRGYLTLDPLRYTHLVYSIVLPLVFVLLGGIGLPGGAVFIDRSALRGRFTDSAVSAAGPLTNAAFSLILAFVIGQRAALGGPAGFWAALAFLTFLQVTAAILNALPVPGLDGFGVLEPFLPQRWLRSLAPVASYGILLIFVLLWIPALNRLFFSAVLALLGVLGVPDGLVSYGDSLFRFWLGGGT